MTGARSKQNDTLGSYLEQAAHDLARSHESLGDAAEGLLFLGAWHQSYPAILVRDPFLSDSAKVQFLYLMQESSQNPRGAIAMPSLVQTGQVLGHSKKTVHRDRTLLRVCRWISQHKRVRDDRGRYCGSINAIHSEPCSLSEANRLDRSYLQLLNHTRAHPDRYVQRAAQAALASIDQALQDGRDPLDPPDPMNRRLDAAKAVQNGGGSFFDLLMPDGGSIAKAHDPSDAGHSVASADGEAKFTPGDRRASNPSVNFGAEQGGHSVASAQTEAKFTPGAPSVNSTPGQSDPSVNFTPGQQTPDISAKRYSYPQKAKFTLGPTSSSSSNNTTTTDSTKQSENKSLLHWPETLPSNEQTLIERSFVSMELTGEQQQNVLDALAHKLRDPDHPMRSPVGYAVALCKRVRSGTFQPVGAPSRDSADRGTGDGKQPRGPRGELNELRGRIHTLQSEIQGMDDNLIPYANPESKPQLEAQRDRLCQERDTLKQRFQSLRGESAAPRRRQA